MVNNKQQLVSRFATSNEISTDDFSRINHEISVLHKKFGLPDQRDLNLGRFDWLDDSLAGPQFYASRRWEYPFAILSAELSEGLTCADVGCGTTPFTAYLCQSVGGKNVTAVDFDLIPEGMEEKHVAFGVKESYIKQIGCNFVKSSIDKINCPDNSFDRVFCISVFEHIDDPQVKFNGIMELARILKPGGKLITTFDLGLKSPFTHPLDVIKYSGLVLDGNLDLNWPKERFAEYDSVSIDVFGLALKKPLGSIFINQERKKEIESTKAYDSIIQASFLRELNYRQIMVGRDFKNKLSLFKIFLKIILGRY